MKNLDPLVLRAVGNDWSCLLGENCLILLTIRSGPKPELFGVASIYLVYYLVILLHITYYHTIQ